MYDTPQNICGSTLSQCETHKPLSPIEHLYIRRKNLESSLSEVNDAISALEKNPELSNILHLVGKAIGSRNY